MQLEVEADKRSLISVKALHFSYLQRDGSRISALKGIDCDFQSGLFHVILGRNGSGKSTLSRCLNGILQPEMGYVEVLGLSTSAPQNLGEIRFQVGMVFQDPENQLVANTVEEEVAFGLENQGLDSLEIRERVEWALERVGLAGRERTDPHALSQGQKQLVALAGSLALKPRFLVSDESTSMLDWPSRRRVMDLFLNLRDEYSMGIIHVTHFVEEALEADRITILDEGRVRETGSPKEVFASAARVREMGIDPPAATLVIDGLRDIGWKPPEGITRIEELCGWLGI